MVNQADFSLKKHSIGVGDRFGYKERFFHALEGCRAVIAQRVTENLFVNHLQPLFIG